MDIDSSLASSSSKLSSDTPDSPIDKRPKYDPVQADLKAKLDKISNEDRWSFLMQLADDHDVEYGWQSFFRIVVFDVTSALALTDRKGEFIHALNGEEAGKIVERFSQEDIKILRDGVRKGIKDGIWEDLIRHRACTYDKQR